MTPLAVNPHLDQNKRYLLKNNLMRNINPEFASGRGRRRKLLGSFFPELLNRVVSNTLASLGIKRSSRGFVFGLTPNAKSGIKFLFLLFVFFPACVKNPATGKREVHLISQDVELNLGKEATQQITKEYGLYVNPQVQAYINEVGEKLVKVCERPDIHYSFIVLDTPLVNAFAVPGTVFVTRGILNLIDDEAELAVVLGHELGHITHYHAVRLIQRAYGYGFLATLGAVAGTIYTPSFQTSNEYAAYYESLYRGIGLITASFLTGYGREYELEADQAGLRYAVLAGYDPDATLSFFNRMEQLEKKEESKVSLFLRTHPPTDARIRQIDEIMKETESAHPPKTRTPQQKEFQEIMRSTSTQFKDDFMRYQNIVRTLPETKGEWVGAITGQKYSNEKLNISLEVPRKWTLRLGYGQSLVSFTSEDGRAEGELQYAIVGAPAALERGAENTVAGIATASVTLTSETWGKSLENKFPYELRTRRTIEYPSGPAYVGTYWGMDRLGRGAYYKIFFLIHPRSQDIDKPAPQYDGYMIAMAAPHENYLNYLLDFEMILRSFNLGLKSK